MSTTRPACPCGSTLFSDIESTRGTREHYFDLLTGQQWTEDEEIEVLSSAGPFCHTCRKPVTSDIFEALIELAWRV